jgi:choline-sulfatase
MLWRLPFLLLCFVAACGGRGVSNLGSREPPLATASSTPPPPPASGAPEVAAPATKPAPKRPYNVLFLMIDSLRADMPWAGYSRDIAPWLTAFAKRSTLYPRAYSMSSYTAKSVVPTLAGLYPSEMKRDGLFFTRWSEDNVLLTERARSVGIRTLAGNGHGYFMPPYGVNQGFDDYRLLKGTFLDNTGVQDVNSDRLNELAKQMLSDPANTSGDKPFFAYFHFLDPHYRYVRHKDHPDYGKRRRDLYDNEVHFTDQWVGDLVDWALGQPWGKNLAVVITADHGEGFGERGHYRHAYEVWESLVRVPLFIHVPGAPPRRIEESRGAISLAPTIADLLGMPLDPYRGKSLLPEVFGAKAESTPVMVDLPRCDLMDKRRALVVGDYKLVVFGDDQKYMLFDVKNDFEEKQNLAKTQPEKLAEMQALYAQLSKEIVTLPVTGSATLKGAPPGQRH